MSTEPKFCWISTGRPAAEWCGMAPKSWNSRYASSAMTLSWPSARLGAISTSWRRARAGRSSPWLLAGAPRALAASGRPPFRAKPRDAGCGGKDLSPGGRETEGQRQWGNWSMTSSYCCWASERASRRGADCPLRGAGLPHPPQDRRDTGRGASGHQRLRSRPGRGGPQPLVMHAEGGR